MKPGVASRDHLEAYRSEGECYLVEVKLRDLRQLFNALDPSPFPRRDLDAAAEEYLVSAVRELGVRPVKLVLHLPPQTTNQEASAAELAIRHYFEYRARHTGEQLRLLLGRGVISFVIGLAFLFVCLSLRRLFDTLSGAGGASLISEGLLILGWVAMWRPVEIFLYDWWPEMGKRRMFDRISRLTIEARVGPASDILSFGARDPSPTGHDS